jgi:hypothetical protein
MNRQFFNPPPISMSFDAFVPLPPPISVDYNSFEPPAPPQPESRPVFDLRAFDSGKLPASQPDPPASNSVPASKARGGVQSAPKGPNPITEATIKVIDQMSASVGGIVPLLIGGGVLLIILLR